MVKAKAAAEPASTSGDRANAAAKPTGSAKATNALPAPAASAPFNPPRPKSTQRSIDLYYWPTPNGWKISIMLEECGLPYALRPVDIGAGDQFKPEFLAISPNNRMPAIVDPDGPDGKPVSVFESGAILQYLAN